MFGQKMLPGAGHLRRTLIPALVGLVVVGAACSSGETSGGSGERPAATSTTSRSTSTSSRSGTSAPAEAPSSSDRLFPDGLRDVRYCEVLLLRKTTTEFEAEVWNTIGYSDCPEADWDALDQAAIAKERGVVAALLNGPRYWTLDEIVSDIRESAPTTTFGAIEMFRAATVPLGATIPDQSPYVPRTVDRETVFRFRAGSEIYELTDPEGRVYVMQSYALIKDPTLTIDRLASLGSVLQLPAGWRFGSRVLDEDLDVLSTDGEATITQDDLQNTYQRIDSQETR